MPPVPPIRKGVDAHVPCGSCNACCRVNGFVVDLHPEEGDDLSTYEWDLVWRSDKKEWSHALKRGEKGECIYLKENRCSIYERRPATCRQFDCRNYYRGEDANRQLRQKAVKAMPGIREVFDAARKRMP